MAAYAQARLLVASIVALVLVGSVTFGSPATGAERSWSRPGVDAGPSVPDLDWAPCGADFPGLDCATATVPLDYDKPHGRTTDVALARWPAADQRHRIGTVFVNPGGPGGSGVQMVLSGFGEGLAGELDGRFDVVGFDPRGIGASDPFRCFDTEDELNAYFEGLPLFPYQRGQFLPFFRTYRALSDECLDDRDDRRIAKHMSTADVARDLNLLRRAVGDRKLTYLGFSYGSYIGNTFANLFPGRIRALAIDGVLHPRLWADGEHIRLDRTSTGDVFGEFLRLCDAARDECAFWTPGGSSARWESLARSIRREPLSLPDTGGTFLYTYDFLINDSNGAMYAPEVWDGADGFAAFLDLLADLALEDAVATRRVTAARAELLDQLSPPAPEEEYDNGLDAYFGNHCADAEYPRSFAAWFAIDRYARAGSRWGPTWWWFNAGCADWPVADDRYDGPWTARSSAPVLVVGNFFDPATAYAGAVASDRLLRNSRLLSYAGWGHTAYGRSACVTEYTNAYLVTGALPPRGTVCPANPNPFLPSAAKRAADLPVAGLPPVLGAVRD